MRSNRHRTFVRYSLPGAELWAFAAFASLSLCGQGRAGYIISDLGTLPGYPMSYARGLNDAGQIIGTSFISGVSSYHGFLYSGGTMMDIGTLGGANSEANAINNSGQVAGLADLSNGYQHAILYSGGVMTNLGTLGGSSSGAWGNQQRRANRWHL